jgi:hypothetical protein
MGTLRIAVILLLFSPDDWSQASSEFQAAATGNSIPKFAGAVDAIAKDNSSRAAKLLLGGLSTKRTEAYWIIISGLGKVTAGEGMAELERVLLSKGGDAALKRDLMMSLGVNSSDASTALLLKIAAEGTPELQVTAIDELVRRECRETVPVLTKLLPLEKKKGLGELARQARKALVNLVGQDQGSADSWGTWWEKNKDTFKVGERSSGDVDTVVATIRRNRALDYEELKSGKKEEILILLGDFDGVQDVVDSLKIPNTVCARDAFGRQDLSKCKVLIVNCTDYRGSGHLKKGDIERIRNFVNSGGYLFTSDWGLADVLEDAFPGYIQRGGETPQLGSAIFPKKGSGTHPFLREVFCKLQNGRLVERTIDHSWQIDSQSYALAYDATKVIALVEAPELQTSAMPTAVAVTFTVGPGGAAYVATGGVYEDVSQQKGGRVLHVMSHFSKQKSKQDGYTLQNMLLNFLIEAKDRKRASDKK